MNRLLKYKALISLIILTVFSTNAQNRVEKACDDFLQVRQIPMSEKQLSQYFADYMAYDTVFAIIFPPANCPRCECMIPTVMAGLDAIRPEIPTILISVYPDSIAAKEYIDRYALRTEHYFNDDSNRFKRFLSFNAGYLHIPYLLKVLPSTGNLLVGVPADDASPAFLRDFCSYDKMIEKKQYEISKTQTGYFSVPNKSLRIKSQLKLMTPVDFSLSEIIYNPEFYENKLLFNDKLREGIEYFTISQEDSTMFEFKREIKTTPEQNRKFIQVPDNIYNSKLASHDVRFIPLSPKMIGNDMVAISYSLPKLWYVKENTLGYMNQASALLINPDSIYDGEVIPFIKNVYGDFFYPHFNIFKYGDDFVMGCERMTWPIEFEKEEYCDNPEFNPFDEEFYAYSQPTMAIFDGKTGVIKRRVGYLPELAKVTLTGYYFEAPVADTWKDEVVTSDGFTGVVNISNLNDSSYVQQIEVFKIPEDLIPKPDSRYFYTYDCVTQYLPLFNRNIVDMKLADDYLYCLVRYGMHGKEDIATDRYSVIKVDRSCNCVTEQSFEVDYNSIQAYGLRRTNTGAIQPYTVTKGSDGWGISIFEFS